MYKALYRKYRPSAFEDVVGQEHITETLKNQVAAGRLSHAYLFVGTRGTGKTTCAKILAKAVNCQHPVNGDPCNECPSCVGINNGSILDVVELDAASNNGVENIRAIRDEAIYTPSEVRKRVYIVDEVHMLSTAAFNALLKILEEPPEHLIFILATTELHKVPATILSRCQRYSFKRLTVEDISKRLDWVAKQENIALTKDASMLLARLADGAMRDGLSLLDQCRSTDTIDEAQVMACIGLSGAAETAKLLGCIENGDTAAALGILDNLYTAGKDPGGVLTELSSMMRDIMVMRMAGNGGEALISGTFSLNTLKGRKITTEKLMWCLRTVQDAITTIDRSPNRRTAAEMCLIQLTNDVLYTDTGALLARISDIEQKLAAGATAIPAPRQSVTTPPVSDDAPPWDEEPTPPPEVKAPVQKPAVPTPPPAPAPEPAPVSAESDGTWDKIVSLLDPSKSRLLRGKKAEITDGHITVYVDGFAFNVLNKPETITAISDAASKVIGKPINAVISNKAQTAVPQTDRLDELRKFDNIKFS